MLCPYCNYQMTAFDTDCPRCHGKGIPQPHEPQQPNATWANTPAANPSQLGTEWYYAQNGQRIGPVQHAQIAQLVSNGSFTAQTMVWRNGMPDWTAAGLTDLNALFVNRIAPPPLTGEAVDNTIVWILAFAPLGSVFVQVVLGAMANEPAYNFWWIALVINIGLCLADERQLKKAGQTSNGMTGWVFLVPVYLFARASRLQQNNSYAIVWLVTFFLSLFF